MARNLLRLAVILLMLTVSLVGINSSYAFAYGTITITSAPYAIETGDEPSISVHAEWSGAYGMYVRIGLNVRNYYGGFSYGANLTSYGAECMSGCESNVTDGKVDATFSLALEISYPGSFYLYPNSLIIHAVLSQCVPNGLSGESQCTVIASSQPTTITLTIIGAPPLP